MARDYEDLGSADALNDEELRAKVRETLADNGGIDVDNVTVRVRDGEVQLLGRVGTEEELRTAEHVLTDVVGVSSFRNELVVDALRRTEEEEAADDAVEARDTGDYILGDKPVPLSPEADHLVEDLEGEMYGTHDLQKAIESGESYSPPDRATPEGIDARLGRQTHGEDH
jgi:hypothetical protein